jgi:hypothetical protein
VTPGSLPARVQRFLSAFARSLDELEILLNLIDSDTRWWDARTMAAESGTDPAEARRTLEALASCNLLDIRITDEVRYRLRPGTPEVADLVFQLAEIHRTYPRRLVQWVSERSRSNAV